MAESPTPGARRSEAHPLSVLVAGAGPVGLVYAALLSAAGHRVWVLSLGRLTDLPHHLTLRDLGSRESSEFSPTYVRDVAGQAFDVVIVAVGRDRIGSVIDVVRSLANKPRILTLGHVPDGHRAFPEDLDVQLGFPGFIGQIEDGNLEYVRLADVPTTLEHDPSEISRAVVKAIAHGGFTVTDTIHMEGWLAHRVLVNAVLGNAVVLRGGDPLAVGTDLPLMMRLAKAIQEGFAALAEQGYQGAPWLQRVYATPALLPLAARWWGRQLQLQTADLVHGVFARTHAVELRLLADWVLAVADDATTDTSTLRSVLA